LHRQSIQQLSSSAKQLVFSLFGFSGAEPLDICYIEEV
jgi:hypothetical protein